MIRALLIILFAFKATVAILDKPHALADAFHESGEAVERAEAFQSRIEIVITAIFRTRVELITFVRSTRRRATAIFGFGALDAAALAGVRFLARGTKQGNSSESAFPLYLHSSHPSPVLADCSAGWTS